MITEFEQDLPLESIRSLTSAIYNRDFDKRQFGLDLLNVQSYVMGKTLSGPAIVGAAPTHDPSDEEALSALNQLEQTEQTSESEHLIVGSPATGAVLLILKWALKKFVNEYL